MDKLLLPPNDSLAALIKKQINEVDDEKMEHNLKLFEKWIECQPHLPKNYEKNMLKIYLRGTKHDLEAAKKKFELNVFYRTTVPTIGQYKVFTEDELKIVKNLMAAPMPHLTDDGCRISFCSLRDPNIDLCDFNLQLRNIWKIGHIRTCKEQLIAGDIYVFDVANATPAHISKWLASDLKNSIYFLQEGFPFRIRQIHLVNAPSYVGKFVSIVKMFFKEKLRNRIFVHQGMSEIKKYISEKSLPKEFGGVAGSSDDTFLKWMQYFDDHQHWFDEQEQLKLIGEIPKRMSTTNIDLGVEGSFRQLSID